MAEKMMSVEINKKRAISYINNYINLLHIYHPTPDKNNMSLEKIFF